MKYLMPSIAQTSYITNFYDASGHMVRGAYVVVTGHTDPGVDGYFDLQPGFFWWTGIYVNIVWGPQNNYLAPPFIFLMKYYSIILLVLAIPILIQLFRKLGLSLSQSFFAFFVFVMISITRYHYSAQAYTYLLFWLAIEILATKNFDIRSIVMLVLLFASTVFLHQGTTLYMLIAVFSLIIFSLCGKSLLREKGYSKLIYIFLLTSSIWLSRLMYMTVYTFKNFVDTLEAVIQTILRESTYIVQKSLLRSYPLWQTIVLYKAVFYIGMVVTLFLILLYRIWRARDKKSGLLFSISAGLVILLSPIALSLGGAGYIERVYDILTPLMAFSFLSLMNNAAKARKERYFITPLAMFLIIFASISGFIFYFSGRNFQSLLYSEVYIHNFFVGYGPNIASIYSKLNIQPILQLDYLNITLERGVLYSYAWHQDIELLYYKFGDIEILNHIKTVLILNTDLLYNSKTTMAFYNSYL
ncbi:MAG: hypothetical protein QXO83_00085 [Desulfurococcus sp.]